MARNSEPKTIPWREAVTKVAAAGHKEPELVLLRAIIDGVVGYYPRTVLDLQKQYDLGLLDPKTGGIRMHARGSPRYIQPVLADIEEHFDLTNEGSGTERRDERPGPQHRGGRPARYDWEAFYCEIIRRANTPDGLPEKREDLTKAMKEWSVRTWDDDPADSLLREKIAKVYRSIDGDR